MIFGQNGDKVIQKMQEWAQAKLESAFDPKHSIKFLEQLPLDSWKFYGNEFEGMKQKKGQVIWSCEKGQKHELTGYFHDNELVGNIHIKHFGKLQYNSFLSASFKLHVKVLLFCFAECFQ